MKKILLLFLTFISLNVIAQNDYFKIKEGSFTHVAGAVMDDAKEHTDVDDKPMALFKISTENINNEERQKLYFTGNRVTEISGKVYKTGQVWIYLTAEGSEYLEIRHPDYGSTRFYFPESLCDFCTYEMVLQYVPLSEAIVQSNYLIIKSDQADARIFIDDTLVGKQFIHKQFNVGSSHTWRVECDLYHTETGEVEITAEENYIDLKMKPEYGFVNITSVPNFAKVYVDDNYVGDTPYSSEKMNIGNYTIRVEKDEYQSTEKNVVVNDKLTTKESFYLQSNYVDITINADKDSDIYVDNIYKGRGRWEGKLLYGIHDVEARKANHRTVNSNVELVIGETKAITLDAPVPIYGMLEISSNPTEASVYIDGKYCGQTPMQLAQIIIGNHELKLEKQGCASLTKTFAIKEGETLDINESLQTGKAITISTEETGDKIYVDEKYIGVTPLTVNLSYDTHLIKAERGNKIVSKTITVSQYGGDDVVNLVFNEINGHEYVDLGLSVKWATCNVGANKPEEFGDYFAWGETTPKSEYTSDNSLTNRIAEDKMYAQCIVDKNGNLTPWNDAATANWGGTWRMPTESELEELVNKCTWTETTQNGVEGYKVTGPNGNSIFLPDAGHYHDKKRYGGLGGQSLYWGSNLIVDYYRFNDEAASLYKSFLNGTTVNYSSSALRFLGGSVRPVNEMLQHTVDNIQQASGAINGYEYVDLGLSVKWATCNVGANKPEDFGNYYAWGETTTKSEYDDSNSLTYEIKISRLQKRGIIDSNGNLTSSYDVATANWGGTWRMPTKSELEELEDKCTWTLTKQNNVVGYKVTGPNGNSIFLPAAGYRLGSSLNFAGEYGDYWSSTPREGYGDYAYYLYFDSGDQRVSWFYRGSGRSVRPVSE